MNHSNSVEESWLKQNDDGRGTYNINSHTKPKTKLLQSSL